MRSWYLHPRSLVGAVILLVGAVTAPDATASESIPARGGAQQQGGEETDPQRAVEDGRRYLESSGRSFLRSVAGTTRSVEPRTGTSTGSADPFAGATASTGGSAPSTLAELLSSPVGGDLKVSALAVPYPLPKTYPESRDLVAIPIVIEVGGKELVAGNRGDTIPTEIRAYAFDVAGNVADSMSLLLPFDASQQADRLTRGGVKFQGRLDLPPGSYSLRVLVRNQNTGAQAVAAVEVDAPAFSDDELVLLPPLVAELADRWTVVQQDEPPGNREMPYPFTLGRGVSFFPAAEPHLAKGGEAELTLFAFNLADGPVTLESQLLDADGYVVRGQQLSVKERLAAEEGGPEKLIADLALAGVPDGRYTLQVAVSDAGGGRRQESRIPVLVAPPRVAPRVAQAPRRGPKLSGKQAAAMRVSYREVLTQLGRDQLADAGVALARFERAAAAKSRDHRLEGLSRVELSVAKELASRQPAALIPILQLHYDSYMSYLGAREMLLAQHSRGMVQQLADLYEQIGAPPAARRVAARALTSLAGVLQQNGATAPANGLFRRALKLDSGNEAALLGLAAYYEKVGDYPDAIPYLERLVRAHPQNTEGWLRYGINLRRIGREREGERWLAEASQGSAPDWVRTLAFQERARANLAGGRLAEAEAILRRAIGELPTEQGIVLQLLHVLERQGRRDEGAELLARIQSDGPEESTSARYHYNRWPTQVIDRGRRQLANNASDSLPTLAEAIGGGKK